jgi:hypothetical protein
MARLLDVHVFRAELVAAEITLKPLTFSFKAWSFCSPPLAISPLYCYLDSGHILRL